MTLLIRIPKDTTRGDDAMRYQLPPQVRDELARLVYLAIREVTNR